MASSSHGGTSVQRLRKGSATDDWLTPPEILAALGPFDLDPCVPETGPAPWSTATSHYRPTEDGLTAPWFGFVWLNPPYSRPAPWLERLANHGEGIALIFARTETGWWHDFVWPKASRLLFIRRRVSFIAADGDPRIGHNAPAPSVLVAYGAEAAARLDSCSVAGAVVGPSMNQATDAEGGPRG